MKNIKCFIILVLVGSGAFAQTSKFSATLSYPIPVGDNRFENNRGILDFGAQYRFVNAPVVCVGGSLNVGFYTFSIEEDNFKENDRLIQPRVFVELKTTSFRPFAGLGYTFGRFNQLFDNGTSELTYNWSGVNLNVGVSVDILPKVFLVAQFDHVKLSGGDSLPDVNDFTNIGVLKFGAGIRL